MSTELSNAALEEICIALVRRQNAAGLLMLFIHPNDRAEIIAGFSEEVDDLAGKLHRLADEVAAGAGIPVGRNVQNFPHEDPSIS